MFRGVLLFGTVEKIGDYPAILLNVVLYAIAHIPKGLKEILGCFILGPILCILALEMHNIIVPTILHIIVCLSNEYFSIRKEVVKLVNN
jgi:membrane protease YdiL (CAAX protease family)